MEIVGQGRRAPRGELGRGEWAFPLDGCPWGPRPYRDLRFLPFQDGSAGPGEGLHLHPHSLLLQASNVPAASAHKPLLKLFPLPGTLSLRLRLINTLLCLQSSANHCFLQEACPDASARPVAAFPRANGQHPVCLPKD